MGMPMRALNMLFVSCLAGKFFRAMSVAVGMLHSVASRVAVTLMWMVLRVMSSISDICRCRLTDYWYSSG